MRFYFVPIPLEKMSNFKEELKRLGIPQREYLQVAKHYAHSHGYTPENLQFSTRQNKKLMLTHPEGVTHFGEANYKDFIIYGLLAMRGKIDENIPFQKRDAYLKRASKIKSKGNYSPNRLAMDILWDA
jgi:hypothetical protein